jgi:hypothetical protein
VGNIQLKNVPDDVHAELRARAAGSRMTIRDYVLRLIELDQQTAPLHEWLDELGTREPMKTDVDVAELIRQGREERTEQILRAVHGDPGR